MRLTLSNKWPLVGLLLVMLAFTVSAEGEQASCSAPTSGNSKSSGSSGTSRGGDSGASSSSVDSFAPQQEGFLKKVLNG